MTVAFALCLCTLAYGSGALLTRIREGADPDCLRLFARDLELHPNIGLLQIMTLGHAMEPTFWSRYAVVRDSPSPPQKAGHLLSLSRASHRTGPTSSTASRCRPALPAGVQARASATTS